MTVTPEHPSRLLLPAAILFAAVCLLVPVEAFATLIDTRPCRTSSGGIKVTNILSWIFSALFLVTAADNFFLAKRKRVQLNVKKILVDVLACITLAGLPFLSQAVLGDYRWTSGLAVSTAGGWLAYRLLRSEPFKVVTSAGLAIGFAAVLSWPTVFYTYNALHPPGCVNGRLQPAEEVGK
ncbi:MAG: hypothetical protein ACAH80_15310 [Alphaproteobacteria bacterium]